VTAAGIRAILLDIEGTTTPIAFVTDVLFGYARTHLQSHLAQHQASAALASIADRLGDERASDEHAGQTVPPWVEEPLTARLASVARYVEWLMDRDRKSTPLKELQGWIWEEGYRGGTLVGEVFADVPPALASWHARGVGIGTFSSGSVLAQQLLFRHSSAGDLTRYLGWFFDTTTGPKSDPASYRRIAAAIGVAAEAVLFISDVTRELDAARSAGLQTRLSLRPGNVPQTTSGDHIAIGSFSDLVVN
jgi:enolase-phosphatase E1